MGPGYGLARRRRLRGVAAAGSEAVEISLGCLSSGYRGDRVPAVATAAIIISNNNNTMSTSAQGPTPPPVPPPPPQPQQQLRQPQQQPDPPAAGAADYGIARLPGTAGGRVGAGVRRLAGGSAHVRPRALPRRHASFLHSPRRRFVSALPPARSRPAPTGSASRKGWL